MKEESRKQFEYGDSRVLPDYQRIMDDHPVLGKEDTTKLSLIYHRYKNAKDARNRERSEQAYKKLLYHNIRIVFKIAYMYQNHGLDLTDLVQSGMIGLSKAVEKYRPKHGASFYTYGHWWVWQGILKALGTTSHNIKISIYRQAQIRRTLSLMTRLEDKFGRPPTLEEVAKELKKSVNYVEDLLGFQKLLNTISLDSPVGDDPNGYTLAEVLTDKSAVDPSDLVGQQSLMEKLRDVLGTLTERERRVLEFRFGLNDGGEGITLDDVGEILGVTRERIRQIEAKALMRLRLPSRMKQLINLKYESLSY